MLSHAVTNSGLNEFGVTRLQDHLANLSQSLSACDRILNTPIPLSYTRLVYHSEVCAGSLLCALQQSVLQDRSLCS